MSEQRRRDLGEGNGPIEDDLQNSFDNTVGAGAERLHRTLRTTLITGFFGGLEVGLGIMAMLAVLTDTGNHLLAGIAFSIGFIALLLAHSELFTENLLVPIAALVAREGSILQLLKLWSGTLVANLAGGWVFMWLIVQAFPQWHQTLATSAHHFVDAGFSVQSAVLAILGGSTITLMTRMQQGTDSDPAKIIAAVAGAFLLAGLQLFHSILDSLLIFGAIQSGAGITYADWLGFFGYTLLFNILGGIVLVTALRLVRTKELLDEKRDTAARSNADPAAFLRSFRGGQPASRQGPAPNRAWRQGRRTVPPMTDTNDTTPDGSTHITDEQKKHTDSLGDGSPSGDATKDPEKESDVTSGGEPE